MTTGLQTLPPAPSSGSQLSGLADARAAFQNHEDRLLELEAVAERLFEGFPHLADSHGRSRTPRNLTFGEEGAIVPAAPLEVQLAGFERRQANVEALLTTLLDRLNATGASAVATAVDPADAPPQPPIPTEHPW